MSRKQLREPTSKQRSAGLPTSKKQAIELGITRFIPADGKERVIRQYGSRKFPNGSIELDSSRRANRGVVQRSQATVTTSEQQFLDFGKRNGYSSKESKAVYDRFVARNKAQIASVPQGMHNDHFLPHKSKFYQAGENYRTKLALQPKVNTYKTDKMPTGPELRGLGMPTSQTELIRQEFANAPLPDSKQARSLAGHIASQPNRERARESNKRLELAQQRRKRREQLKVNGNGNGNGNGYTNGKPNGKPNGVNATRLVRSLAVGPLSIGAGLMATGQSGLAAVKNPTLHNVQDFGMDFANLAADVAGLYPPAAPASEAVQKSLGFGHAAMIARRRGLNIKPPK